MKKFTNKFKNILFADISLSFKWWAVILIIVILGSFISYNSGTSNKLNKVVLQEVNLTIDKAKEFDKEQINEINLLTSNKEELSSTLLSKDNSKKSMEEYSSNKTKFSTQISQVSAEITQLDSTIQQKQTELNQKIAAKEEQRRLAAEQEALAKKSESSSVIVYKGQTGTKYHRQNCRTLKNGAYPITLDEALSEGRAPCKVCKP